MLAYGVAHVVNVLITLERSLARAEVIAPKIDDCGSALKYDYFRIIRVCGSRLPVARVVEPALR